MEVTAGKSLVARKRVGRVRTSNHVGALNMGTRSLKGGTVLLRACSRILVRHVWWRLKMPLELGTVATAVIPALGRLRQVDYHGFKPA